MTQSYNPGEHAHRYGLFRFRSPLLTESLPIYFPLGTEMFHFPGYRFGNLCIQLPMPEHYFRRVAPFRYLRIKAYLQLPEAFHLSLTVLVRYRSPGSI